MELFGKILVERGVLSSAQLDEATQSQVVFGGRLGTNLVELGYMRLDDLERRLADHLGVATAPVDWIEAPEPSAIQAIPKDLAQRHGLLPLRIEKRTLHVAMLDPRDPGRIDDVAFATGLRVQPYVMAEVRLSALLEHHYGIPRDTRYINLGVEAARGSRSHPQNRTEAVGASEDSAPTIDDHQAVLRAEELGMRPLDAGQELIDEQTFSTLHESSHKEWSSAGHPSEAASSEDVAPASTERAAPLEVETATIEDSARTAAALEVLLGRTSDRETVSDLALRIGRLQTIAAALFVVRGGVISGLRGDGHEIPVRLDGILLPADAPSVFASAASSGEPCRSEAPFEGIDARVQDALGRADVAEVLVVPIAIRQRVVNLLYADNGSDPIGHVAVAALSALSERIASSYERLILERKQSLDRPS